MITSPIRRWWLLHRSHLVLGEFIPVNRIGKFGKEKVFRIILFGSLMPFYDILQEYNFPTLVVTVNTFLINSFKNYAR